METTLSRDKWGIRLYQSFAEGTQPRKIADQVAMEDLLSARGYGLILSALMAKYKPFLDIAGPTSIDKFFYMGERGKSESFATFLAAKEVARQEMEQNLQERIPDRVAGRILLRQSNLSEFQRELISLKDNATMLSFDEVAAMLRPLDRPEMLAQAAQSELGTHASKHYPVMYAETEELPVQDEDPQEDGEDYEETSESEFDELYFEDKEFEEDEAIYIQAYHSAYADVRRDLRERRRERGFINHNKVAGSKASTPRPSKDKGRGHVPRRKFGKGAGKRSGKGQGSNGKMMRGTAEQLVSRARCYNCQELGHYARDCPLKGSGKGNKATFVVTRGTSGSNFMVCSESETWPCVQAPPLNKIPNVAVYAGIRVRGHEASSIRQPKTPSSERLPSRRWYRSSDSTTSNRSRSPFLAWRPRVPALEARRSSRPSSTSPFRSLDCTDCFALMSFRTVSWPHPRFCR